VRLAVVFNHPPEVDKTIQSRWFQRSQCVRLAVVFNHPPEVDKTISNLQSRWFQRSVASACGLLWFLTTLLKLTKQSPIALVSAQHNPFLRLTLPSGQTKKSR
jgi:hypothetical protein